jgi:hypothetical protein
MRFQEKSGHLVVGMTNLLFVTLDCLHFDVATACFAANRIPNLAVRIPRQWEKVWA